MFHLDPEILKPTGFDTTLHVYNPLAQRLFTYTLSRTAIKEIAMKNNARLPTAYSNVESIANTLRKLSLCEPSSTPIDQTESMILYLLTCFLHNSQKGKHFIATQEDSVLDAVLILYPRLSEIDTKFYQFFTFTNLSSSAKRTNVDELKALIRDNMKAFHDRGNQKRFKSIPSWVYGMR